MDIVDWLRELRMSTSNADWNSAIVNNRLDETANEIERLRVDVEVFEDRRIKASVYANDLHQENEKLCEALRFYANRKHYDLFVRSHTSMGEYETSHILDDAGSIAREALGEK